MPQTERRALALASLALLVLPTLAATPPASAQTGQADLEIAQISAANPRYLVPTTVTVAVENRGTAPFDTTQGWQFFVGWGGTDVNDCINGGAIKQDQPCFQRFPPGLFNRAIQPGERLTYSIAWTPGQVGDVKQRGDGTFYGLIMPFGTTPNAAHKENPPSIPGENPSNNVRSFAVTVNAPLVRAVPLRDAAPDAEDKNEFWRHEQIDTECLDPNQTTVKGCRMRPGAEARFAYTVYNLGTSADSFSGALVYGSPDQERALQAKGYRFSLSTNVVALPQGGSQTVFLTVYMPEGELHNRGVNLNDTNEGPSAWLRWSSTLDPAVHTSSVHCNGDPFCVDPSLPTVYAGIRRGINATSNETYKQARAGEPVTFNARVENPGNYVDSYNVTILSERSTVNESWRPRINVPPSVGAFGAANVSIDLVPPADVPKGLYEMEVRLRSVGDATGAAVANLTFRADLQQRFGLLSSLLPSYVEAAPGEKTSYVVTVTNTGNGPDNVTLALGNVPFGWDVTLQDAVLQLPPLGSNSTRLNITAPAGMAANARADVKINVTSQGSNDPTGVPRVTAGELTASLVVLARPNPELTLDGAARRFVDAGAGTDFVFTLRNAGNLASNFTLVPENPDPAWAVTATPSSLVLNPLESGTVAVRLRAPGDAVVGETLRVIVTARSTVDERRLDQETIVGAVSGPDLALKGIIANTTAPYSGDPLALDVIIANEGNKAPGRNVTLRASFIQGGVERVIAERDYESVDLPGGRRFTDRIVWDTTGVEGAGVLVVRVDPSDAVREIDDGATSNEASLALDLRTFDVTVTPPQGLSGRPGEKVTYGERPHVFVLRHRGNAATEPVRVLVESQNGWVDPERTSLSMELPRGAEVPIPIEVLIPFRPGAATDSLRVTVVPDLRPGSPVSAATTTRVLDDEKPVVTGVLATPARAKLGQNVTLEATVRDATGVASVKAHVVSPSNDTTVLSMAPTGGDRWVLTQTFNVAGTYRFFVEASDRADPANVNATRGQLVEFLVDPGSAPVIRLEDGQPTTIRTGTPVRLNITDPLGIARAAYHIRGIRYDMPRPYQIDTSGFRNGTTEVEVEAENLYGVKSTARFNITVDNAPPGIRSVRLDPETPKANEDAILRIETDPKVTAVDVVIRKDGAILDTRSAERKGPGVFELLLNPGEGDYVLDVTAKDDAGNVKLEEGAVKFSAKPASPFDTPGPGAWLVLAAVAVAVLVTRRRRG